MMQARVRKGRLVLDVATDLPDGTLVEVVIADPEGDTLGAEERSKRDAAVRRGIADGRAGRTVKAADVLRSWKATPAARRAR
jgi:predicted transcriptional regulator